MRGCATIRTETKAPFDPPAKCDLARYYELLALDRCLKHGEYMEALVRHVRAVARSSRARQATHARYPPPAGECRQSCPRDVKEQLPADRDAVLDLFAKDIRVSVHTPSKHTPADREEDEKARAEIMTRLHATMPSVAAAIEGGDFVAPLQAYADFRLRCIIDEIALELFTLHELKLVITRDVHGKDRTWNAPCPVRHAAGCSSTCDGVVQKQGRRRLLATERRPKSASTR